MSIFDVGCLSCKLRKLILCTDTHIRNYKVFSSDVNFASQHLFSPQYKGRIYAFFRNPVDRCVSKFYYLQTATWERTYRPEWVGMSIIDWAMNHNFDENFLVKKINGKPRLEIVPHGKITDS